MQRVEAGGNKFTLSEWASSRLPRPASREAKPPQPALDRETILTPWQPDSAPYIPAPAATASPLSSPRVQENQSTIDATAGRWPDLSDPFSSKRPDYDPEDKVAQKAAGPQYLTDAEQAVADQETAQSDRKAALKGGGRRRDTYQMTPEDYAALSPKQRAAVDFNTMLAKAVHTDLANKDKYTAGDVQLQTYDKAVTDMFGEGGGSDLFAPETMAVLRQIDFQDPAGDLDHFLSMKAAITDKDLKGLNLSTVTPAVSPTEAASTGEADRYALSAGLAGDTLKRMDELMKGGEIVLSNVLDTATANRTEDVTGLGGFTPKLDQPAGWQPIDPMQLENPTDLNSFIQSSYAALSTPSLVSTPAAKILADIRNTLTEPGEMEAWLTYADTRSKQALDYGKELGDQTDVKYLSPEDFRALLGLDK